MTDGLKDTQVTILTWLVYALITFLTVVTAWQQLQLSSLPKEFVRLERYRADAARSDGALCRIENKLDKLIMETRNLEK